MSKVGFKLNMEKKESENKTIRFPLPLIKEIEKVLVRAKNYESYLSKIYTLINKKQSILKIDWLEVN